MTPMQINKHTLLIVAAILLATNILTGLLTAKTVRAHDFAQSNLNCLLNWGGTTDQFEDAEERTLPHDHPLTQEQLYRMKENNARGALRQFLSNQSLANSNEKTLSLFCWAVAAATYRQENIDIPIDPAVWQAYLRDGPKDLPIYWWMRESLTDAGADQGLIHGTNKWGPSGPKPSLYHMGPLPRPSRPLPS